MNHLPPLWLLKYLPNMLACHVTILHGAEGPSNTITCAEASGLLSLGESMRVIQRGDADACFSGGAESKLNYMAMLRMDLAGRMAHTSQQDGREIVKPFAKDSAGGVLGEAGAVLIVEERSHAAARGATPYARLSGFGAAQSCAAPLATGVWEPLEPGVERGLVDAIEAALRDAGLRADEIDAIVPLGLGVVEQDEREAGALREVFGERLGALPLITLVPHVGNCSAGQGGLMAAAAALAIRHQSLPGRIQRGVVADGLHAGAASARGARLNHVLVCAPALGGQNAALILSSL
jgi:3-oxoacyl-[acyl-carrier-protein] synthase II